MKHKSLKQIREEVREVNLQFKKDIKKLRQLFYYIQAMI